MSTAALAHEVKSAAPQRSVARELRVSRPRPVHEQAHTRDAEQPDAGAASKAPWSFSGISIHAPAAGQEGSRGADRSHDSEPAESKGQIPIAEAAAKFQQARKQTLLRGQPESAVRFRLPTGADMASLWNSHTVSEKVFKDRVETALTRMQEDSSFVVKEPIAAMMARVFPTPGVFDQAAYEALVGVGNRTNGSAKDAAKKNVYGNVAEATSKIHKSDKPEFLKQIDASIDLIKQSEADDVNLTKVFGTKKSTAKANYVKARASLGATKGRLDTNVTTDYNLDDDEVGLGGSALFSDQTMHFEGAIVQVDDVKETKTTVIHEASHLSNPAVLDQGYYFDTGYEYAPEQLKVENAAHYEEVPRRILGTSRFPDAKKPGEFITFVPGQKGGGAPTYEDEARRIAAKYAQQAWDTAVNVDQLVRQVRTEEVQGLRMSIAGHRNRLMEISKLIGLTIHEQAGGKELVNQLDVVLAEGVAHAVVRVQGVIPTIAIPPPQEVAVKRGPIKPPKPDAMDDESAGGGADYDSPRFEHISRTSDDAAMEMVSNAVKDIGGITKSHDNDMKLLQWLVDHFEKAL